MHIRCQRDAGTKCINVILSEIVFVTLIRVLGKQTNEFIVFYTQNNVKHIRDKFYLHYYTKAPRKEDLNFCI